MKPAGTPNGVWEERLAVCRHDPTREHLVWEASTVARARDTARNIRAGRVKTAQEYTARHEGHLVYARLLNGSN